MHRIPAICLACLSLCLACADVGAQVVPPDGSATSRGALAAPDDDPLVLGRRFELTVTWTDFSGNRGRGTGRLLTADTASFWFFRPSNVELTVKVLDGRPVNGHYWVFYGSLTNVAFELVVRDTVSGQVRRYQNPLRHFASRGDTTAFPQAVPAALAGLDRLLFVGAHPDDEVIAAPLLGELCHTGTACTLLVATLGEAGTCRLPQGCGGDLGAVRRHEMQTAAGVLGAALVQWTLPDVSAAGPAGVLARWADTAGGEERLRDDLAAVLSRRAPQAVITFDPRHGSTGHPAHRALGALVLEVAERAGVEAPPVYLLATRVDLTGSGDKLEYSFSPAEPVPPLLTTDATLPSAVVPGTRWQYLLRNATAHPSQLDAPRREALATVPDDQRRVWLRAP